MLSKYIITDVGALLFNKNVTHKIAAEGFKKIYSAGFCKITFSTYGLHNVVCYGHSESLVLNAIPEFDQKVITDTLKEASAQDYFGVTVQDIYEEFMEGKSDESKD
jgi:hypothetical protein